MGLADILDPVVTATAAAAAGLTGDALVMSVAVAGAESGFYALAANTKPGETPSGQPAGSCGSYGFWQINSCRERDAGSLVRFGDRPEMLLNPIVNARSMVAISSGGTNWQPWTGYTSGAYRKYVADAQKAVTKIDPKKVAEWAAYDIDNPPKGSNDIGFKISTPFGDLTSSSGITGKAADVLNTGKDAVDKVAGIVADPLKAIGTFFSALLDPSTWLRAAAMIVGLALFALGLNFIMTDLGYGPSPSDLAKVAVLA